MLHVVLQELLHPSRFVVFPVILHVVLQRTATPFNRSVPCNTTRSTTRGQELPVVLPVVLQELLHPSRFVVFPVVLHVILHVVPQELLDPSP